MLPGIDAKGTLIAALGDLRRTWPQLLLADLLARFLAFSLLAPAVGLLVRAVLSRTDSGVLSDQEILFFFMSPSGLIALVVVGSSILGILFAEISALMVVGFGATEDRRISYLEAMGHAYRHARELLVLAGSVILRLLALAVPFLLAAVLVAKLTLGSHDINYYLANRPPEMILAVSLGIVLGLVFLTLLLRRLASWLLALPMVLFSGQRAGVALRKSAQALGRPRALAVGLLLWIATFVLLTAAVAGVSGWLTGLLASMAGSRLGLVAMALLVGLALNGLGQILLSFLANALFALLAVRLYREQAGPGDLGPGAPAIGTLGERASWKIPSKAVLATALAVTAIAGIVTFLALDDLGTAESADVIAHRGASKAAPENTMAAFEQAIEDGADWIEIDVQESADGIVVVQHDSDFMKVSGNPVKIWEAQAAEMRKIDIGSWFDPAFADQRVPTLREVLELARGKAGVVIELKYYGHDENLEARVVEEVEAAEMIASVSLMSLKRSGIEKAAALRPDWKRGLLSTVDLGDPTLLDVHFLALNAAAATRSMIRRAHANDKEIYVWTVNDPIQISMMLSRGVDGLITDEPALARKVMEFREGLTPIGRLALWLAAESGFLRSTEQVSQKQSA